MSSPAPRIQSQGDAALGTSTVSRPGNLCAGASSGWGVYWNHSGPSCALGSGSGSASKGPALGAPDSRGCSDSGVSSPDPSYHFSELSLSFRRTGSKSRTQRERTVKVMKEAPSRAHPRRGNEGHHVFNHSAKQGPRASEHAEDARNEQNIIFALEMHCCSLPHSWSAGQLGSKGWKRREGGCGRTGVSSS